MDYKDLLGNVELADGSLDPKISIALWALGKEPVEKISGPHRGDDGGDEYTVDLPHYRFHVNESDFPDRSVDAALAVLDRVLPGWDFGLDRDDGQFFATIAPIGVSMAKGYKGEACSLPLAILAALLKALDTADRWAGLDAALDRAGEKLE